MNLRMQDSGGAYWNQFKKSDAIVIPPNSNLVEINNKLNPAGLKQLLGYHDAPALAKAKEEQRKVGEVRYARSQRRQEREWKKERADGFDEELEELSEKIDEVNYCMYEEELYLDEDEYQEEFEDPDNLICCCNFGYGYGS